ncbi:MAG TPA: hypothetical protein VN922_19160, partial [Bacteroidia bacterium]|nr:hypothetical protein [Bacteroidia bacterium]
MINNKLDIPVEDLKRMEADALNYGEQSHDLYATTLNASQISYYAGAKAEYLRHASKPTIGLGWVKASERFPQNEEVNKIWHIKPIRDGFDFYMFLKYVQDFEKEGPPSFRLNLWDGHHAWTRKIMPELLSKIEWLEELESIPSAEPAGPKMRCTKHHTSYQRGTMCPECAKETVPAEPAKESRPQPKKITTLKGVVDWIDKDAAEHAKAQPNGGNQF